MLSKSRNSDPFSEFAALYPYLGCTQIEARLLALRLPLQRFTDRTVASGHTMTHLVAPMHASTLLITYQAHPVSQCGPYSCK